MPDYINNQMPFADPFAGSEATLPPQGGAHVSYPFTSSQGTDQGMFPPVCLRTHWDPEKIIRRTLPAEEIGVPLEPRPWTKINMEYKTSQEFVDAPRPNDSLVMPGGGVNYPPSRFKEAVDKESVLRRLDRPLGPCGSKEYKVPLTGGLFRANSTVPERTLPNSRFMQELSFPMACIRDEEDYSCRANTHTESFERSTKPFNNATKQDRYRPEKPFQGESLGK
jgi:hypothetical protein